MTVRLPACSMVLAVALSVIGGCTNDGFELNVDVRSDFAPGTEARAARTVLSKAGVDLEVRDARFNSSSLLVEGVRAAVFSGLAPGDYRIDLDLLGDGDAMLGSRGALVNVSENTALVIPISRACSGRVCPVPGGDPSLTECANGVCVSPDCLGTDCEGACRSEMECPPASGCLTPICAAGECLTAPDSTLCDASQTCATSGVCVSMMSDTGPPPADTGADTVSPTDAGPVYPCPGVVDRVFGANRYETAAALARITRPSAATVVVARGDGGMMPDGSSEPLSSDAIVGAVLAANLGAPLLLVAQDSLPVPTRTALMELSPTRVILIGGTAAITSTVESAISALGISTSRIAGATRYDTAAQIAGMVGASSGTAVVSNGENVHLVDALVGAAAAAASGQPLLYVNTVSVPAATRTALADLGITRVYLVGGTIPIPDSVATALGVPTTRISGANRYETAVAAAGMLAPLATASALVEGTTPTDGMAAAALARSLLYVQTSVLSAPVASYLPVSAIGRAFVMGGPAVIDEAVVRQACASLR